MNTSPTTTTLSTSPSRYPVSLLAALRGLVPKRPLTTREAERIAELQANRFRELLGIREPNLPEKAIASLPRIMVSYDFDLPVSGLAQRSNGRWLIALNGQEPEVRQRFSLAHELFHVINYTTERWMGAGQSEADRAAAIERLAEYFAACLLMPKRHVKRLFYAGSTPAYLAALFEVSPRAMRIRLEELGLVETAPRCQPVPIRAPRTGRVYHRSVAQPA